MNFLMVPTNSIDDNIMFLLIPEEIQGHELILSSLWNAESDNWTLHKFAVASL